jgi:hypothetical protein
MATLLQELSSKGQLKSAILSDDGKTLSYESMIIPADEIVSIDHDDKSCQYSLASIFLQILDPSQGLMPYRNACKKYNVLDPIKATDKPLVVSYFLGTSISAAAAAAAQPPLPPPPQPQPQPQPQPPSSTTRTPPQPPKPRPPSHPKKSHDDHKSKRKLDKRDRKSDKKRPSSAPTHPPPPPPPHGKKEKKLITTKEGFELTPEMIPEPEVVDSIMAMEIPVGNSNSILRPAPHRDFQRVLDLYLETENTRKVTNTAPTLQRPYLVGKKPIIVLPQGLTPPVTMWNAYHFFQNSQFIPRDTLVKQGATKSSIRSSIRHKLDIRRGGHEIEFELMDNPTSQLGMHNIREWERVVAVISLGASWQFKDWPRGFSAPVELFTKAFGFYIGLEGNKEPEELQKWAVQKGYLSRDKRSLDSVCFAKFWDGLEDRIITKKPEFIPQKTD